MSRRLWLLAALALAVGFAPAPLPKARRGNPEEQDLRRLQGTWEVIKYESNGRNVLGQPGNYLFTFEGRRTICVMNNHRTDWTFELSVGTAPRQITSTDVKNQTVLRGIYRFEGDTFVLCETVGDVPRPTTFESKGQATLQVLRRR